MKPYFYVIYQAEFIAISVECQISESLVKCGVEEIYQRNWKGVNLCTTLILHSFCTHLITRKKNCNESNLKEK